MRYGYAVTKYQPDTGWRSVCSRSEKQNSCMGVLQVRGLVCAGKVSLDAGSLAAVSPCLL